MIRIIDNFVPEILFQRVEEAVTSYDFPWFFLKDTTYRIKYSNNDARWDEGFSCLVMLRKFEEDYEFKAPAYEVFLPMLAHFEFALGLNVNDLVRCKVNLGTTSVTADPFDPHVDMPFYRNTTAILCVNDSDGPTYIYDQKCPVGVSPQVSLDTYLENKDSFKLLEKVEPKRNRLILFPGEYYHSGSRPVDHKTRINVNFNWLRPESP
jgi:hypothetical protein